VKARNGQHDSESSAVVPVKIDGEAIIGAVNGLTVTGHNSSSVSLQWNTVQGVEGYYINIRGPPTYANFDTKISDNTTYTGI
jgi:hypothetical protein